MYKAPYFLVLMTTVFSCKEHAPTTVSSVDDILVKINNAASAESLLDDEFAKEHGGEKPVLIYGRSGPTTFVSAFQNKPEPLIDSLSDDIFVKTTNSNKPGSRGRKSTTPVPAITTESSGSCVLNKVKGECVPYYACDADFSAYIDIHLPLHYTEDIRCESFLEVCCLKLKNIKTNGHIILEDVYSKNNTSSGQNVSDDVFSKNNTATGNPLLQEVFSKNNTRSGHNVLDDVSNKNHTGDRQIILEDIYINNGNRQKSVGSREPTVAPIVPAFQNKLGPGSESVLEDLFGTTTNSNNSGGAGKKPNATIPSAVTPESNTTCVTRKNEEGECVVYYLCDVDVDVDAADQDEHITDWRDLPCESLLDVCCPKATRIDLKNTTATVKPPPVVSRDPVRVDYNKREGCGWRNTDGAAFQIAGIADQEYTNFAEFPWVAAILKYEPENKTDLTYIGGGSLIHPNVVLTAAHHVDASHGLLVRLGEWDTQTTKEIYPHQDRDVAKVEIHKDFNKGNLFYDIALLFLATPVNPAPNIGVVCLPPPKQRALAGTRCLSTGWGKDQFGREGVNSTVLRKVDIPVVERKECLSALRKTRLGSIFELHSSFMCAGGETIRDTCKVDGGSPLVCPIEKEKNRYVQNGIVAWGIGCGSDGPPGVYVDVGKLREWIDDKVKGQGYDIFGYSYTV